MTFAVLAIEFSLETLVLALGGILTGGGSLLSGFAAVIVAFRQGIETATRAAATTKEAG